MRRVAVFEVAFERHLDRDELALTPRPRLAAERRASGQVEQRWEWSREGERVDWAARRWRIELLCSEEEEASAELDEGASG